MQIHLPALTIYILDNLYSSRCEIGVDTDEVNPREVFAQIIYFHCLKLFESQIDKPCCEILA